VGLVTTVGQERKRAKWYAKAPHAVLFNFPFLSQREIVEP